MTSQKRIFLGHASEDKPRVRDLYQKLKARGFEPWLDAVDLLPGENWRVAIPKAIKAAGVFLACLSKQSVAKQSYVQREFRYALSKYAELPAESIYLIPVRLDDCEVPDLRMPELELNLRDLHWVDLFEDDGFDRLVASIERTLGMPSSENSSEGAVKKGSSTAVPRSQASAKAGTAGVSSKESDHGSDREADVLAQRASAEAKPSPSSLARNPTITAAWIGAAAVIVAGILTSPWLAGLFVPADQQVEPKTNTSREPAAAATNVSANASTNDRQPFETYRDCDQDLCPAMIMLPAGSFMMGSPSDEEERVNDREGPQHPVTISTPFAMGKTEVTFELYDRFAEANGREKPDDRGWGRGPLR